MSTIRSTRATALAATIWAIVCAAGFSFLWAYKSRPGLEASAPARWPEGAADREPGRPALVMLVHPRCACTDAALDELAWILARAPRAAATLLLVRPPGVPEGWERSDTWRKAKAVRGARALLDESGAVAARFGARVSGQMVVYDGDGRLSFSGGITLARGHRGGNDGRDAALAALRGEDGAASFPVYGCPLTSPATGQAGVMLL